MSFKLGDTDFMHDIFVGGDHAGKVISKSPGSEDEIHWFESKFGRPDNTLIDIYDEPIEFKDFNDCCRAVEEWYSSIGT